MKILGSTIRLVFLLWAALFLFAVMVPAQSRSVSAGVTASCDRRSAVFRSMSLALIPRLPSGVTVVATLWGTISMQPATKTATKSQ